MLEEAEDRAARAAVEGWQIRAGGKVISRLPKPYNDNLLYCGRPLIIIESPYGATSCAIPNMRALAF